jgi:hypothetical protein
MRLWWGTIGCSLVAGAAAAQELQINEADYAELKALKPVVKTFVPAPPLSIWETLKIKDAEIGQILRGQSLQVRTGRGLDSHWVLDDRSAEVPLSLANGSDGPIAGIVRDAAFGGNALAGVGPRQTGVGRYWLGTGIVTILFDDLQCLFGLRTALDGAQDNIVMRDYPEGNLNVIFWNEAGEELADFRRYLDRGVSEIGYIQSSGSNPEIKAITIQNLDPGGIGIAEIIYAPLCPMIVSSLPAAGRPG